jgi:hypothetical protein
MFVKVVLNESLMAQNGVWIQESTVYHEGALKCVMQAIEREGMQAHVGLQTCQTHHPEKMNPSLERKCKHRDRYGLIATLYMDISGTIRFVARIEIGMVMY